MVLETIFYIAGTLFVLYAIFKAEDDFEKWIIKIARKVRDEEKVK